MASPARMKSGSKIWALAVAAVIFAVAAAREGCKVRLVQKGLRASWGRRDRRDRKDRKAYPAWQGQQARQAPWGRKDRKEHKDRKGYKGRKAYPDNRERRGPPGRARRRSMAACTMQPASFFFSRRRTHTNRCA